MLRIEFCSRVPPRMFLVNVFKRTFSSNLGAVRASEGEQAVLVRGGVEQATVQNYLAWRRGLLAFVVIVTSLGAGLEFYRENYEEESGIDLFEEVKKHYSLPEAPEVNIEKIKEMIDGSSEKLPDASDVESKVREA